MAESIFGWSRQEAIGRNLSEMIKRQAPDLSERWGRDLPNDISLQSKLVSASGETHLVEFLVTGEAVDAQGESYRIIIANDISHQWLREEQLQRVVGMQAVMNTILHVAMLDKPFQEQLLMILELILAITNLKILPWGAILVAEKKPSQLRLAVHKGLAAGHAEACAVVPVGRCCCGRAAREEMVFFEGDCLTMLDSVEMPCRSLYPEAVNYAIPIRTENRVLGVLVLFLARPMSGPHPAMETMLAVTNVLAAVLEKEEMRRERDELIWKMEKLDRYSTIAEIASAVAHEVRNPLAGIKAISQVVESQLGPVDKNLEHMARIINQVDRLNVLLNDFFAYARPPKPLKKLSNLKEIFGKVVPLLRSRAENNSIVIAAHLSDELSPVMVDPQQIQQVFLNILLNGLDAVKVQGRIEIFAEDIGVERSVYNDGRFPRLTGGVPYVVVQIRDSGEGMEDQVREKIFEPFYTTKTTGTGLGLAIVMRILKEHDAALFVESCPGQGSTFFIFFKTNGIA